MGFSCETYKVRNERETEMTNQEKLMRSIYNASSTMIHEKKYKVMRCVLCGKKMKNIHDTHNPFPLTDACYAKEALENKNPNRCCSKCNEERVKPARFQMMTMMSQAKPAITQASRATLDRFFQ